MHHRDVGGPSLNNNNNNNNQHTHFRQLSINGASLGSNPQPSPSSTTSPMNSNSPTTMTSGGNGSSSVINISSSSSANCESIKIVNDEALKLLEAAVQMDNRGNFADALCFYVEGSQALVNSLKYERTEKCKTLLRRLVVYSIGRAEFLKTRVRRSTPNNSIRLDATPPSQQQQQSPITATLIPIEGETSPSSSSSSSSSNVDVSQPIGFLLYFSCASQFTEEKAITEDEHFNHDLARFFYIAAVSNLLNLLQYESNEQRKSAIHRKIRDYTDRAEMLQKKMTISSIPRKLDPISETAPLTKEEKDVLRQSSFIGGRTYLPWIENLDANPNAPSSGGNSVPAALALDQEQFLYDPHQPYADPDGTLELSETQRAQFGSWKRPSEFIQRGIPSMIYVISSNNITQTVVTDCSFVASLCVAAQHEKRTRKPLITRIIYPQNELGIPIYNPSGKYVIKLFFNGIPRKVVIDDLFPLSKDGELLCSYSNIRSELWVSLIEKAYLKFRGGYNFSGSNSGIDLHTLTGWIPEEISLSSVRGNPAAVDRLWKRIVTSFKYNDCLVTISTGSELSETDADNLGLYRMHSYALLDVQEAQGFRLLQIKNPWTHKRWRGRFSEHDVTSWTRQLQEELHYDLMRALNYDDGVFWCDFDSMLEYFQVMHMSWNPSLFRYHAITHYRWEFPTEASGNANFFSPGSSPQYSLEVSASESGSVWIMLTRHVTNWTDFNARYITLHIFDNRGGRRVYYPERPFVRGTYTNNPHYLVQLDLERGQHTYTLVVSQFDAIEPFSYTLNVYSTLPIRLAQIPLTMSFEVRVQGEWAESTSGGSCNDLHNFWRNPQYRFLVKRRTNLLLRLESSKKKSEESPRTDAAFDDGRHQTIRTTTTTTPTPSRRSFDNTESADGGTTDSGSSVVRVIPPSNHNINIMVFGNHGLPIDIATTDIVITSSGLYRPGFCFCEMVAEPNFPYTLVVSTFRRGEFSSYTLTIESSDVPVEISPLVAKPR